MDVELLDKLTESLRKVERRVDFEKCKVCKESVEENKEYRKLLKEQENLETPTEAQIRRKDGLTIISYLSSLWFISFLLILFLISRGHYKLIQILYGPMDNQPFIWTLLFWIFIGMLLLNIFGFGYMFWSIPAQIYTVIAKKYNISKTTNKKKYYTLLVFLIFSSTFILSPWILHYVFGVWNYDIGDPYSGPNGNAQFILKDWGVLNDWYCYQIDLKKGDKFFAEDHLEDLHKLISEYKLNSFLGVLDLYGPWKYIYMFYALLGIGAITLTEYTIWEQKKQQKDIQIKKKNLQQKLSQTPRYIINSQLLSSHNLTPEQCKSELERFVKSPEKALFTLIKPYLSNALTHFEAERYSEARDDFKKALEKLSSAELPLSREALEAYKISADFSEVKARFILSKKLWSDVLGLMVELSDALYLEDEERLKSLAGQFKKLIKRRDSFTLDGVDFFSKLLELGYFMVKPGGRTTGEKTRTKKSEALTPVQFTPSPTTPKTFPSELAEFYTEVEYIGKGGFARVFKAKRRKDGKVVAVKIPISLDPATGKSFLREIENWTKLKHPNIVRVYDYNILPIPFFEMEYCESSLEKLPKPMDVRDAALLIFNAAEGLKYAHSKGIIHRDLKPSNVLLRNGMPKVSDWGLSKVVTESRSTTTTSFTPLYAAPEQLSRAKFGRTDERTDIWQLGVIFYELVTGRPPFESDDYYELMAMILNDEPVPPSQLNPEVKEVEPIIMRMLAKRKEDRYESVAELQGDLATYLGIELRNELKKSQTIGDRGRIIYYLGNLLLLSMKTGSLSGAYKYASDFTRMTSGELKAQFEELREQIKLRMEEGLELPVELIEKAEILVHEALIK